MIRRFIFTLSVLLAGVCFVSGIAAASVYSGNCETEGPWQYTVLKDGSARIVGYTDPDFEGELKIPEKVNSHTVTSIRGLSLMKRITKLSIPDSVTALGINAFTGDSSLEEVKLPSSLATIGMYAFKETGLKKVGIPGSVTDVGDHAFSDTPLETVEFVPGEQIRIRGNPFANTRVEHFSVPEEHPDLASCQGVLFDKNEKKLLSYPAAAAVQEYTIPQGIRVIGQSAFEGTRTTRINIPDTVTRIEDRAFYKSSLVEPILPDSVDTLGEMSFSGCKSLKSIRLGSGLGTIGNFAFSGCSLLQRIEIPENVREIGTGIFNNCEALTEIAVSGGNPFFCVQDHCLIETEFARVIAFPGGISVNTLEIPDGILVVGDDALSGARIKHIILPESVRMLGDQSFSYMSSLSSIQLNKGLLFIDGSCFSNSLNLNGIRIPRSVGRIGYDPFPETDKLKVEVGAGSYAESYCRQKGIPFTCTDDSEETGPIPFSSPVLGFSELPAEDLRNSVSEYLKGLSKGEKLPKSGQKQGFPARSASWN